MKKFNLSYKILLITLFMGEILFMPLTYAEQSMFFMPKPEGIASTEKSYSLRQGVLTEVKDALKEQTIPFILLGTIVEPKPENSLAVIKDMSSEKQGIYKIGERILGYQIAKILRARVVLLKNGKLSLLDFPLGVDLEPIVVVSSDERIINRAALAKKIPDLNVAVKKVIPVPHIESGKIIGFKILKLRDKALASLVGIKEGDVLMSVNGEKLNSIKDTLNIYPRMRNLEKINLEIKRGDKVKNLVYHIL